jgi:hypothetical protein
MKRGIFVLGTLFVLLPGVALAQIPTCSLSGYTVVFVNGIFNTYQQALNSSGELQFKLGDSYKSEKLTVKLGYNQTHLAGAGDLFESYFPSWDSYDLNTILLDIYPKVTTQKLFVVGHSQGGMYANKIYEYLVSHGEPKAALGVYAVGTADSYVAGGGKYLTYKLDPVINAIRGIRGLNPLPGNIDLIDLTPDVPVEGHSFIAQYLAGAGDRVVSDIKGELSALKASGRDEPGGCFAPPDTGLGYAVEKTLLAVADPVADKTRDGVIAGYGGAKTAVVAASSAAKAGYSSLALAVQSIKTLFSFNLSTKEQDEAAFQVAKALYGSSVDTADIKTIIEGKDLGSAAALATQPAQKKTEQKKDGQPADLVLGAETDTPAQASSSARIRAGYSGGSVGVMAESTFVEESGDAVAPESPEVPDTATSTEDMASSTEEIATSSEPMPYVMASQSDDSNFCAGNWRHCYTVDNGPQVRIDLGQGSGLGGGTILSVTIAKEDNAVYPYPWIITIECWVDQLHTVPCPDWAAPSSWNGQQTSVFAQFASTTSDRKYWTAYFTDKYLDRAFDNSSPVRFKPDYYYTLLINDDGWHFGAYGSATEPYWVLTGMK